jgi:uncharacterized protein (DUF2225 family)
MTELQNIVLDCPVCRRHFASPAVVSSDASGGRRTDFRECAEGTPPLPFFVHMCPCCGYTGAERDFAPELEVTPALRDRVWAELEPLARRAPVGGSEKYEAAAKVAEWQGLEPRHVADLLLRAAWCCVDEGDVEAERFFRRKAAWAFEKALESWDGVAREERAVLTYLVGELWRRVGDATLSRDWFDRVQTEVVDQATQQWVMDAARQQRDCPREWFG